MKTLVINQESQTQRMAFQKKQLDSLGMDFQRVLSYKLTGPDDVTYKKYFDTWQRPLTVSEVSCFLSHKSAWETVLSADCPMLILEDDAWLDKGIVSVLKQLNNMEGIDYATLEISRLNRKKLVATQPQYTFLEKNLFRLYQGRSGAAGYILWPSGAKKLLNLTTKNKIGIADKFINSCYSLDAYQVEPGLVIQLDQCAFHDIDPPLQVESTIATKTEYKPKVIQQIRYKFRRIIGEAKVGLNILKYSLNTKRRHIELSENFKKSAKT